MFESSHADDLPVIQFPRISQNHQLPLFIGNPRSQTPQPSQIIDLEIWCLSHGLFMTSDFHPRCVWPIMDTLAKLSPLFPDFRRKPYQSLPQSILLGFASIRALTTGFKSMYEGAASLTLYGALSFTQRRPSRTREMISAKPG